MGIMRRILVGVGCATCVVLAGRIDAQSPSQAAALRTQLRSPSAGQSTDGAPLYAVPESTAEGVLKQMASRAAVIFSGTVTAVKQGTDEALRSNAAASIVEVDFLVDHAVRGSSAGSVYAMREWAGLWRDSPRFAVGQRVLMLLHAAGPGGLSSPVDGMDGAIPIKAIDSATPLAVLASGAADSAPQDDAVDMRWLQAKTLKSQTFSDAPTASPGENFPGGLAPTQTLGVSSSSTTSTTSEPSATTGLTRVLGLLMSWQETGNASS